MINNANQIGMMKIFVANFYFKYKYGDYNAGNKQKMLLSSVRYLRYYIDLLNGERILFKEKPTISYNIMITENNEIQVLFNDCVNDPKVKQLLKQHSE